MIYNTGSDFNLSSGAPDSSDGDTLGSTSAKFGKISISGSNVQLTGLINATSPFNGMLFYQRRWNTQSSSITGNGGSTVLGGTIYAKWSNFSLSGSGGYDAQFIVGSMDITGQANVTLNYAGKNLGKANQVFLVE